MQEKSYPLVLSVEHSVSRPEDAAAALERLNPLLRRLVEEARRLEQAESATRLATRVYTKVTCGFMKAMP